MLKRLASIITPPSAATLAQRELEEARRQLLAAQTAQDWARSQVDYHQARIRRLEATQRAAMQ